MRRHQKQEIRAADDTSDIVQQDQSAPKII